MSERPATPQRILIVRLTAIGDVIHGVPVLCALREAFPQAYIGWVAEGRGADVLSGHPALDALIKAPRHWYYSLREIGRLRCELARHRFDTTVDLQNLTKSALMAWLSGAPRRIGAAAEHRRELAGWLNNEAAPSHAPHVIEHYLNLLRPLGVIDPDVRFDLAETPSDGLFADRLLTEQRLPAEEFVILNPGAGWPSKLWPAERYGELARQLYDSHGAPSLAVWGTPDERPLAEAIVANSGGAAQLAPPTTMGQLGAVTRRARLFVGSDTGPLHLAVAVGTPAISLHGPSRAAWCGAYGDGNIAIQSPLEATTAMKRPTADNAAMCAITLEEVRAACERLLRRSAVLSLRGRAG